MSTLQALETPPKSYLTTAPLLQGHRADTDLGCCFSVVPAELGFKGCSWFALLYFGDRVSHFIAQGVFELLILSPEMLGSWAYDTKSIFFFLNFFSYLKICTLPEDAGFQPKLGNAECHFPAW